MTVWKFPLTLADSQAVSMPLDAEILCIQVQGAATPCLWARVEEHHPLTERRIEMRGTGHSVESDLRYIGTVQLYGGTLVLHAFEDPR